MTEVEIREAEEAQAKYNKAWIEASYIVAVWSPVIVLLDPSGNEVEIEGCPDYIPTDDLD